MNSHIPKCPRITTSTSSQTMEVSESLTGYAASMWLFFVFCWNKTVLGLSCFTLPTFELYAGLFVSFPASGLTDLHANPHLHTCAYHTRARHINHLRVTQVVCSGMTLRIIPGIGRSICDPHFQCHGTGSMSVLGAAKPSNLSGGRR